MKRKKLGIYFIVLMLIGSFTFASTGIQAYAATLGEQLQQPETGWTRYNISESEGFIISDNISIETNNSAAWNGDWLHTQYENQTVKFKFKGTKIRVTGYSAYNRSDDASITIDGIEELMPHHNYQGTGHLPQALIYEKIGLEDKIHEVTITAGTNNGYNLCLDAIDIDGELVDINTNIPLAPLNLIAATGNGQVDLSWDSVTDADSYNVKRSTVSGGPYTTVSQAVYETSYSDTDVVNGTTYYYVVTAVNAGGESDNSNEASATPKAPSAGRALLKITMTNGSINEYDLSMTEVDSFITWYDNRVGGTGKAYYTIDKNYNIGPFISRKDYIIFDKVLQFEVMEYTE